MGVNEDSYLPHHLLICPAFDLEFQDWMSKKKGCFTQAQLIQKYQQSSIIGNENFKYLCKEIR